MSESANSAAVRVLAQRCIERMDALGLRGKRADDAALHFFCGAAAVADATGAVDLAKHIGRVAQMIIAVRGMLGVREIAQIAPGTLQHRIVLRHGPSPGQLGIEAARRDGC